MTYQILSHAWRMIIGNLDTVLRLALVPWLIVTFGEAVVSVFFTGQLMIEPGSQRPELMNEPNFILVSGLYGLSAGILTLWIVVGWHRFILLEEQPVGMFPRWNGKRMLSYLGHGILVGLACAVPVILAMIVMMVLLGTEPTGIQELLMQAVLTFVIMYFSLRVSLILPACAIGEHVPMRESWRLTGTIQGAILGVSAIIMVIALVPWVMIAFFGTGLIMFLIYSVLSGVLSLLGVSVLTTLYGILVEKRALT